MIKLSSEEYLINKLLYTTTKDYHKIVNKISIEKFLKICSSHLILPAIYCIIIKKKIKNLFPQDFIEYAGKIYEINKNRNVVLLDELKEISNILAREKISYCFIKGSSLILNDTFDDIGERMIGDIDIIVEKSSFKKSIEILKKAGYKKQGNGLYINEIYRHYPRLISQKKLFSIELHDKLLRYGYKKEISCEEILSNKKNKKNIYFSNVSDEINYTILTHQINDWGFIKYSYNHKNFYDYHSLRKRIKRHAVKSKYHKNYIDKMQIMGIEKKIEKKDINKIDKIIFSLLKRNKILNFFYISGISFFIKMQNQLIKLFYISKKLR